MTSSALALLLLLALGAQTSRGAPGAKMTTTKDAGPAAQQAMRITSPAFANGGEIPTKHTCEGPDVMPALSIEGVPAGTRSLALIVDDPDAPDPKAPKRVWVHAVLYNLPPTTGALPEGLDAARAPQGAAFGTNDWGKQAWGGPCPPVGRHRYFFKLYALDAPLAGLRAPTKAELLQAMQGHVLAEAELMGTYEKKKRGA